MKFGPFLNEVRTKKNLSINQLSKLSGVSAAQISRVETGQRATPKPETIKKLADALEYPYEIFMGEAGYIERR